MALIVDIETAGEKWAEIDKQTQQLLGERVRRYGEAEELRCAAVAQENLGFSPFTSTIVAIGMLDSDKNQGAIYFQGTDNDCQSLKIEGLKFAGGTEREILEKFWIAAERYREFVTFNGRGFDVPFLLLRSAVHNIRPNKDLMRSRYLYQQAPDAIHIDLYDQLRFYGSISNIGGLHLACRAFGIKSPKSGVIDGAKVGEYFHGGKIREIVEYNGRDLFATGELYRRWKKFLAV